jgi:hypothetical protein
MFVIVQKICSSLHFVILPILMLSLNLPQRPNKVSFSLLSLSTSKLRRLSYNQRLKCFKNYLGRTLRKNLGLEGICHQDFVLCYFQLLVVRNKQVCLFLSNSPIHHPQCLIYPAGLSSKKFLFIFF